VPGRSLIASSYKGLLYIRRRYIDAEFLPDATKHTFRYNRTVGRRSEGLWHCNRKSRFTQLRGHGASMKVPKSLPMASRIRQ